MILVTGATGHVGSELIAKLVAGGQPVRAMTRRPATVKVPPGVELAYGDCDDAGSLAAAFDGTDRAFLMSAQAPGSAEYPSHDLRLIDAARRAGVRHVVKLSVYSGGDGDDAIGAWHREAEAAVIDSGIEWTLLRPGRFMSNALQWAPMIQHGDTVHVPFASRAAASIDPADIAAVALVALTTEGHRNIAYQLSGPEVLTPAEELAILAEVLGRPLRLIEPPIDTVKSAMRAAGTPAHVIGAIVARAQGSEGTDVLPTVAQIIGRPPTTFRQWATTYAALFFDKEAQYAPQH